MPKTDRRKHRITKSAKIPKRVMTVNDILARDDVNGILADLDKLKPNIKTLIVIYLDNKDNKYHWRITDGTWVSTATWMLESTKLDLLNSEDEDEKE